MNPFRQPSRPRCGNVASLLTSILSSARRILQRLRPRRSPERRAPSFTPPLHEPCSSGRESAHTKSSQNRLTSVATGLDRFLVPRQMPKGMASPLRPSANVPSNSMFDVRCSMFDVGFFTFCGRPGLLPLTGLLLLLARDAFSAETGVAADPLPALVQMLRESNDPQLQLDILRGLSAAFKGRRQVPMPKGWDQVETRLGQNAQSDVRALAQSLSLTFGSSRALEALRNTATG